MLKRLKAFVTFGLAALLTLVALEGFLRGAEIQLPGVTRYDDVLGLALKSDRRLTRFEEGFYLGGTNSYGYYGIGRPPEKPPGTVRIALIGDSQVEGHQLFARDHFGVVLEGKLHEYTGVPVEVLNFGMSGLNLSDAYCYFTNFATSFSPDITLFLVGRGDLDASPRRTERPYCYLDGDSLKIDYTFTQSPSFRGKRRTEFMRGQSAVLNLVNHAREVGQRGLGPEIVLDKFYTGAPTATGEPEVAPPSETTMRIVEELARREDVYLILAESVPDDLVAQFKRNYERVIDVRECLAGVEGDPRYWVATDKVGHWNHEAHRAVGRYLADVLAPDIENRGNNNEL